MPQERGGPRRLVLTCAGLLLHPTLWEQLAPARVGRGGAPLDDPHVVVHRRLWEQGESRAPHSLGFQSGTRGLGHMNGLDLTKKPHRVGTPGSQDTRKT